jgi:streptogramin lyase
MRSGSLKRGIPLLLLALAIVLSPAAPARAAEPTVVELPIATHATSVAAAPDGTVWFSFYHGSKWEGPEGPAIGHISGGRVAEVPAPVSGRVALGPSGEVWVSGARRNAAGRVRLRIARLSPTGQVLEAFTVGTRKGGIGALAPTRGAVWFVHFRLHGRETIERLSTVDGVLRRFPLRPKCRSNALAVAADGTVWFTEVCPFHDGRRRSAKSSRIAHIKRHGRIVRERPTGRGHPVSLAVAADGSVWFGMADLGYTTPLIGHITGGGALTEYRVPHGEPTSIAVGPQGRLWFPSSFGGGVYRALDSIGASGGLAEPICADPTCKLAPSALARGADGSLWYALTQPHTIGGGGFTQIMEGETIENEAGFIGHLVGQS